MIALQDGFTMRRSLIVEDILLIEPAYKNKYPPIGLMKIAYFHRYIMHDYVRFAKGRLPEGLENKKWDRVYVTTLFTFEWENTKKALQYALSVVKPGGKVFTGGILATLRPEWIAKEFPTVINNTGLLNHEGTLGLKGEECIDTLPLDYGILDDIKDEYKYPAEDAYFTYMTRGCGMNCTFCAVKTLEPTYEPYVSISDSIKRIDKEFGPKRDLLLMDNNVLRSPKFDQIIDEIKALGFEKGATFVNPKTGKTVVRHVDFNQGLDAFLLNEHKAQRLGELAIKPARIAFDHIEDEDVYVRAITLCARAGIDHMSNYLLYNGEDFTGKGHSYHADTPEDLFYRMHLTMELGENLTEELGRKIAIFSFPMRYIPLDNDQRGFIGANWNAKYLRALQCMLIPTQGKGIQGRSFFEADFGKTAEDFVMYLAMPERLLNKRGHFVERKDEPKFEREIRYTQWSENRHLIDTWMKYYSMFEKDTVLEYIGCNRFSVETLDKIENEELKKLYFLYLTPSATIRVFSMIKQKLVQMEVELAEYNVELRTDRTVIDICKPYKNKILADRIRKINDSISDINFVPFYSGEKVTAMLWYAETNFLGTVLDKDIKGIRIRQGNILIGDENTLRKCYKEERFNSWMVGELLVFNEDIIPNTRRDDYEKNSAYKELLSQFTEWANEMSRQIRHRSYERSLTQSDKKFLSDESVTDVDGVDISLGTELDSYDMDDSDSVANTDLLSKLSLLMDMGKKKTKYNVLNLNSKFTVDQKQTLEHVFDALYAKYTNAKANDIIQTIIDSF